MRIFPAIFLAALLSHAAVGQQFYSLLRGANEVPPNRSTGQAYAEFTLTADSLGYSIWIPGFSVGATSVGIYGPARSDHVGELIGLLGLGEDEISWEAPFPPWIPGGAFYDGAIILTDLQTSNILAGLIYVNITSGSFPLGEIRGQLSKIRPKLPSQLSGNVWGVIGNSYQLPSATYGDRGFFIFPLPPQMYLFPVRARVFAMTASRGVVATAVTDDSGFFSMPVSAGSYWVYALCPLFPGQAPSISASPGAFSGESVDFIFSLPGRMRNFVLP